MSAAGFRLFEMLFPPAAELLYVVLLAYFLAPFRRDGARLPVLGLCLALFLAGMAAPRGLLGLLLAALLTSAAGALGLERGTALLLALFYWSARVSGGLVAESLYFLIEEALPPPPVMPEDAYRRAAVLVALFLLLHGGLFAAMLSVLRRRISRRPLHWREVCYLSLMPAAGILFGQVISRLLAEAADMLQLYRRHPLLLAVVPALALLFFAGTCMSLALQQGMARLREEQAAALAEGRQVEMLRDRLRELERLYAQVREFKHETRGHLTAILGLARSGSLADLERYVRQLDGSLRDFEMALRTGNPVTDVIVNNIRGQCLEAGVGFQADFRCPEQLDGFDLGIILQNLLQNAVEACRREPEGARSIWLTGRRRGRFFLVEVENTCTGRVVWGPEGLPLTTKEEPAIHGVGLANVRRTAEKYTGELELRWDGQTFSAAVLLQGRNDL